MNSFFIAKWHTRFHYATHNGNGESILQPTIVGNQVAYQDGRSTAILNFPGITAEMLAAL
jgi:hypothetical protein